MFAGVAAYNGYGDPTDPDRAERIAQATTCQASRAFALSAPARMRQIPGK
jgi:hypothetical protein